MNIVMDDDIRRGGLLLCVHEFKVVFKVCECP